jgi:hypothetical protein
MTHHIPPSELPIGRTSVHLYLSLRGNSLVNLDQEFQLLSGCSWPHMKHDGCPGENSDIDFHPGFQMNNQSIPN